MKRERFGETFVPKNFSELFELDLVLQRSTVNFLATFKLKSSMDDLKYAVSSSTASLLTLLLRVPHCSSSPVSSIASPLRSYD